MTESIEILKIGDLVSIHSEVKGNNYLISSKCYIPSSVTLSPLTNIESYQSLFRIERPRQMIVEQYPNPDDDTDIRNNKSQYINEKSKEQLINFDQPLIFIHYMSGRYLSAKESDGQHVNLVISQDYQKQCQFKLMPMFKCQILGSKRVRQKQQVILRSISYEQNQGNYNLGIVNQQRQKEKQKQKQKFNSMIKTDIFSIKVNKRGNYQNQNQLYYRKLYKLNNIQIQRDLIISNNKLAFFQPQNELETMFYFIKLRDLNSFSAIYQNTNENQNENMYLKSIKYDLFIELHGGQFRTTSKPCKSCQFKLIEYRIPQNHILTKQSVLSLYHVESKRYLSFEFEHQKGDFITKPSTKFDLKDAIQLVLANPNSIKQCFFISQFKSFLQKFNESDLDKFNVMNNLFQLKNVLFQMLIFLFNETKIGCENVINKFFQLDQIQNYSSESYTLFKQWKLGSVLFKTIQIVVSDYRKHLDQINNMTENKNKNKNNKKLLQKDDILQRIDLNSRIIKIMYVLIVGMCKNNLKNTKLFLKFNGCIFKHFDLDLGAMECVIHVFRNNKQFLRLLQSSLEQNKSNANILSNLDDKTYIHLIIHYLRKIPKNKISVAIKIAELLKCLVISNQESIKMNQTIIGEEFSVNKFQQDMFSQIECDDGQLKVTMFEDPEQQQQIIQMYIKKNKYNTELVLVEKLLILYSSLCAGRNFLNVQYFRQKLPLKTILKYINSYSIQGSLKNCFLSLLLNIYLNSFPRVLYVPNNIVCIQPGKKQINYDRYQITDRLLNKQSYQVQIKQVSSYKYDNQLNDIKQQLLKNLMQQLRTRKFNDSTHMIIQILYNYLIFNMLNLKERSQLKQILTQFICSNIEINGEYRQKIYYTIIKILHKFQQYSEQQNCKYVISQLLSDPKRNTINNINNYFDKIISKNNQNQDDIKNTQTINVLFSLCQQFKDSNNSNFIHLVLDTIKKRMIPKRNIIKRLKSTIIIQQPQILQMYNKIKNQIIIQIQINIQKLSISIIRMDKNLMNQSVRKLNQLIQDLIIRFALDDEEYNKRYQYILKQLGIHKIILSFLIQSINDLKLSILTQTAKIYKNCFKFLSYFINNNYGNTKLIIRSIDDLKKYIMHPEMGQSYFFLMLTRNQDIKFAIQENIIPLVIENLPSNIYLVCVLLQYCKKENILNIKFIDKLSKRFLSDQNLFTNILMMKKNRGIIDLALGQRKSNQLIYYTQLFRLLNILFEYTTDKKYMIQMSKRYITYQILLKALNQNDIFQSRKDHNLAYTLLQKQLIKSIKLLKLTEYQSESNKKNQNQDLIETFLQKSLKKIHFYNEQIQNQINSYMNGFMENQLAQIYDILVVTENFKQNSTSLDKSVNFIYYLLNYLGPLVGNILNNYLQNQSGQLTQLNKKQMEIFQQNFSKKIKQIIYDLLTKYDYDKYPMQYSKGISRCEQIFKNKIKLGFVANKQRKQSALIEQDANQVLKNTRLELVLHFITQGTNKQKLLYKTIFDILSADDYFELVQEQRHKFSQIILQILKTQKNIISLLCSAYNNVLSKGNFNNLQDRQNLNNLIMFIRLIINNSNQKQIPLLFINSKIAQSTIKWCSALSFDISIHSKLIILLSEISVTNNTQNSQCQQRIISSLKQLQPASSLEFFQKFKSILKDQKIIYNNLIFNDKRRNKILSQKQLSYQNNYYSPNSLNLALIFIKSLIQGKNTLHKQYIGNDLGFLQILLSLLKSNIKYCLSFSQNFKIYYSISIHKSISQILQTLYHFINYQSTLNIQIAIEKSMIGMFMDILSMNDTLKYQQLVYNKSPFQRLEELILNCPHENYKRYLRQVYNISKSSAKLYKDIPKFINPFLPALPNYLRIKTSVIKIISQLIHLQNKYQHTIIFKSLSESIIKSNILNIYLKHLVIYNKTYQIFAFYNKSKISKDPDIAKGGFKQLIENSNYIQNGFMLVYILRKTQSHRQLIDKEIQQLKRKKVSNRTYMQPIRQVIDFGKDVGNLIKGCFSYCTNKNIDEYTKINEQDEGINNAIRFFLQKSGRIQILKNETLYTIDFPRLPECVRKTELQNEYLDEIDLTSVQSKSDSILKYSSRFILLYENQERYKIQYKSLPFIDVLLQHMNLFRNVSFLIIIVLNLLILINKSVDINSPNYTKQFKLFYAFIVLQMCISYVLFLFFLLKQMPLIILQINKAIEVRRNTYGSNFNTYPWLVRVSIRVWMFIAQPQLLYHLLFTISVTVSFFFPVFVSVLLLDIFIRIPLLRRILMAIWRPKVQIILALVAFVLIQYYFSILLYFSFQSQTYGYCNNLQDCFSFVYFVTYKVVGGFPGYLFQYKQEGQTNFQVSGFSIFEDIYIIITFQIFFAVLIGIIIDNFTILRTQQDQRRNHLQNYCLICGVNKAVINQSNTKTNFRKHIRQDHNIWNYFYFFTYIHKKLPHQRSELQEYMATSLERKSTEWLPLNYMNYLHLKN